MSEENNEEIIAEQTPNRKPLYIALAVVGVLIIGASAFWFYRSRDTGQVVQAPRNITFGDNSTGQVGDNTGEQTVTIQPDQVEKIGLTVETVGETLSSEAMSVAATGVIQPNAYKETPVVSLLGGHVIVACRLRPVEPADRARGVIGSRAVDQHHHARAMLADDPHRPLEQPLALGVAGEHVVEHRQGVHPHQRRFRRVDVALD